MHSLRPDYTMNKQRKFGLASGLLLSLSSPLLHASVSYTPVVSQNYMFALLQCTLFAFPIVALLLVLWSRWKHLRFKQRLQTYLYASAAMMLILFVIVSQQSETISIWSVVVMICHFIVVSLAYFLLKQHSNKVKNTLSGCW